MDNLSCLRCNREIEPGQKSVAIYVFAQTVGVRPRQKSAARRICFCPQCSVSRPMVPSDQMRPAMPSILAGGFAGVLGGGPGVLGGRLGGRLGERKTA